MLEAALEGDVADVPAALLAEALRGVTLRGDARAVPVLCGSAFKNKGVQAPTRPPALSP